MVLPDRIQLTEDHRLSLVIPPKPPALADYVFVIRDYTLPRYRGVELAVDHTTKTKWFVKGDKAIRIPEPIFLMQNQHELAKTLLDLMDKLVGPEQNRVQVWLGLSEDQ